MARFPNDSDSPDFRSLFESIPGSYLVLQPDAPRYSIVAATDAYVRATRRARHELLGRGFFEVFPDNDLDPRATGVRKLGDSLARVLSERTADQMPVQQRAFQPDEAAGEKARWWSLVNTPVLGPDREVLCIIHRIEDVTQLVQLCQGQAGQSPSQRDAESTAPAEDAQAFLPPASLLSQAVQLLADGRRVSEALRQSDQRFRLASKASGLGVYDYDVEGNKLVWSEALWQLLGLTPMEDPTPELLVDLVHPDDLQSFLDANHAAYTGADRGPYEIETRFVRPDGQIRWLLNRAEAFYADPFKGPPSRIIGTVLDITDRKRAEGALRESEARFRGVISISADAIVTIDEEYRILVFNEGAEKIFGYDRTEVLGAPLDILIPARFQQVHRQNVQRFAAGPEPARRMGTQVTNIYGRRKSGEEFPADAAISKLEVGGKKILTVDLRDISEQKRIEQEQQFLAEVGAVLASSLEYEDTLASIARLAVRELADFCLIEVIDEAVTISRVAVHRDLGKAELVEVLRQLPSVRKGPYLGSSVLETRQPLLMGEVTPEHLHSLAQSDEHLRALRALGPKSYMALPLLAHGRLQGTMVLVRTSEQLRYQPRDLPLAEELARRAALAVQSARLYQAAQRAVAARDDVLGIVAHDLRSPLHSILLKSQILSRTAHQPKLAQDAKDIRRSALRMARLIEDLLDVVSMEVGRLKVELLPIPAGQIVADAVDAHRPIAAAACLELRCEQPEQLPQVLADRDRVLQVLANLIDNAIKFTPSGGQITVGAAAQAKEIRFWVADTGPGIASHNLRYLFDRFWQARRADRRGVGLGLSIAKGIVEVHGGRLWLESTSERGSNFCFTLPIVAGCE